MNNRFDVLIVGAGPSGLSVARSAVLGGAHVLLVERKREIGLPVRCGELFPTFDEALRTLPDAHSLMGFYKLLSKKAIANNIRRIRVFSPKNRVFEFSFEGYVLNREMFEKIIASEAESQGAKLQLSTHIEGVIEKSGKKKVLLRGPKGENFVEAKIFICADGFPSKTAELAHLRNHFRAEDVALCIQQKMVNVDFIEDEVVQMFFGSKYAPGGYAWIIPKGNGQANVGLGARLSYLSKASHSVSDYLKFFLKRHPIASQYFFRARSVSLISKLVTTSAMARNICRDGALLVGGAAGMVVAVNGSGIPTALTSGHIAGKVASLNLKSNCQLSAYSAAVKKELDTVLKRGYLYRRIGDRFIYSDTVFDKLLYGITTKTVAKVIRCEPFWPASLIEKACLLER